MRQPGDSVQLWRKASWELHRKNATCFQKEDTAKGWRAWEWETSRYTCLFYCRFLPLTLPPEGRTRWQWAKWGCCWKSASTDQDNWSIGGSWRCTPACMETLILQYFKNKLSDNVSFLLLFGCCKFQNPLWLSTWWWQKITSWFQKNASDHRVKAVTKGWKNSEALFDINPPLVGYSVFSNDTVLSYVLSNCVLPLYRTHYMFVS